MSNLSPTHDDVSCVLERRTESERYMRTTYWDEWTEVLRAIKCRTKPLMKKGDDGKEVEDKSRTNVAFPDINTIWRRNVARITAQPYRLRYTGGSNPMIADMLSAHASYQYDRSNEAMHHVRVCMFAEALGFGVSRIYHDQVAKVMKFRKWIVKGEDVVYRDRASMMRAQGAPEDEIQGAVKELGPEMTDEEIANFIASVGNPAQVHEEVTRYEGPCIKSLFPGDVFFAPGAMSLEESDYVIETMQETDTWLVKQLKTQSYVNDDGEEVPAFDEKIVLQLLKEKGDAFEAGSGADGSENLLRQLESAIGRPDWRQNRNSETTKARKRYKFVRQEDRDKYGRVWITIASEKVKDGPVAKFPLPFDFYGDWSYQDYCPLPDMLGAVGDSTPRLIRHVYAMKNLAIAQDFDYITQGLRPLIKTRRGAEEVDEIIERQGFRQLKCANPADYGFEQIPSLPVGSFERVAHLRSEISEAEPALNTIDSGTKTNPMPGKLATGLIMNAKNADALLQFKVDGLNRYLRKIGQKKLWINQQSGTEPWDIPADYWTDTLREQLSSLSPQDLQQLGVGNEAAMNQPKDWALSDRNGQTVAVRLDPYEIQEDLRVEPEAGSYMAIDDEFRQDAAMKLGALAAQFPGVLDMRKVARFAASTVRGIGNPDDYMQPEQTTPPPPETRVNVSVSVKWTELDPTVQAQLLQNAQIQVDPADLEAQQKIHGLKQLSEGADAAANLLSPAQPEPKPMPGKLSK